MHDEYISREAAVKALFAPGMCYAPIQLQIVKDLPAADVVEVVRCKDCKYGDYDSKPNGAMVCLRTKDGFWREETDFCSYGKRREE